MGTPFILGSGISTYIDAVQLDFGNPTDLSNEQTRDLLIKAIRRINWKLGTTFEYFQAASGIAPMPTEAEGDMIILQAECLLSKRRYASAVSKGISVKDGDTAINSTAAFGGHKEIMSDVCGELEDNIKKYLTKNKSAANYGTLICYDNSNIKTEEDHNGDTSTVTRYYDSPFDESYYQ